MTGPVARPYAHLPAHELRIILAMPDHDDRHALAHYELAVRAHGDRVATTTVTSGGTP